MNRGRVRKNVLTGQKETTDRAVLQRCIELACSVSRYCVPLLCLPHTAKCLPSVEWNPTFISLSSWCWRVKLNSSVSCLFLPAYSIGLLLSSFMIYHTINDSMETLSLSKLTLVLVACVTSGFLYKFKWSLSVFHVNRVMKASGTGLNVLQWGKCMDQLDK